MNKQEYDRKFTFVESQHGVGLSGTYPFMWMILVLFLLGTELMNVNQMNTIYKYTYAEQYYCPGVLSSDRLSRFWWTEFIAGRLRMVTMLLGAVRLCFMRNPWAANMQMFFVLFYLGAEAANAVILGLQIEDCNKVEGNICNDYRWCGVPANAQNSTFCPKNFCTSDGNVSSCPLVNVTLADPILWDPTYVQSDLTWKTEFTISFGTSLALFALALIFTILSYLSRSQKIANNYTDYIGGRQQEGYREPVDFGEIPGEYDSHKTL